MKKNIWIIGFVAILTGAFIAMWAVGKDSASLPSTAGKAKQSIVSEIRPDDHIFGPPDARVTILEWSDFQCPACKIYAPFLEGLVAKYQGEVRLVYRHFPLKSIHFRAEAAALASEAAGKQGKFWEMTKLIFDGQEIWSKERDNSRFESYASEIGLDINQFISDMESDELKEKVNNDLNEIISLGGNSTPTIYVNGILFDTNTGGNGLEAAVTAALNAVQ